MNVTTRPICLWSVGDVEITRVLEFEAALFEPAVIHPKVSTEIIERHRAWLEPKLMGSASGLMTFAFHTPGGMSGEGHLETIDTISGRPLR